MINNHIDECLNSQTTSSHAFSKSFEEPNKRFRKIEDEENENDDENDLKAKENVTKVDHNSILTGKTSIPVGNKMQLDSR